MHAFELFPAPPTENQWLDTPWWNLQRGGAQLALMIEHTVSDETQRDIALRSLHRAIQQAQAGVVAPTQTERLQRTRQTVAPYVPTPMSVVDRMLAIANLSRSDALYDLGCGDGRIVFRAATEYGCFAFGYESDQGLVAQAIAAWGEQDATVRSCTLIQLADATAQWTELRRGASVVTVYWVTETLRKWQPMFKALTPGTRIVSHSFAFDDSWRPAITEDGPADQPYRIYLYVVP